MTSRAHTFLPQERYQAQQAVYKASKGAAAADDEEAGGEEGGDDE